MLKPIVSMNQMAMNESIATTCCYVWNGTSLLGSASLPHGGQLVADSKTTSYVQVGDTRYPLNGTWYNYTKGHANSKAAAASIVTTTLNDGWAYHDYMNPGTLTLMKDASVTDVAPVDFCDHKNPETCPYFKETVFAKSFTHVGATSAHYTWTGGHEWLKDHTAVQFSS